MKLLSFQFAHFKSVQDIFMKNIGNLNILVGPNNAGKSNILDAIEFFFKGWTTDINGDIEYLDVVWPEILREDSIRCTAEVEVSSEFLTEGTDERVHRLLKRSGWTKACIITIKREITPDSRRWTTTDVTLNDIALVRESNILSDESDATLQILARLTQLFWNRFRRLDIVGSKATMSRRSTKGSREVIIRETTTDEISQWINSASSAGRQKFSRFQDMFRFLSVGLEIDLRGSLLEILDGKNRLPIMLAGSGIQHIVELSFELIQDAGILILEAPEAHMHPMMKVELLRRLIEVSKDQQIFLTTHSPTFINRASMSDIWLVQQSDRGTVLDKIDPDTQLPMMLNTLGIQPSDVFMSNSFLFVEENAEKIILPKWGNIHGYDLTLPYVKIIQMEGTSSTRCKADFWKPIIESFLKPSLWLFDGDVDRKIIDDLKALGIPDEHLIMLSLPTIESFYPENEFKDFLVEEYSIKDEHLGELDIALSSQDRTNEIHNFLIQYGDPKPRSMNDWKVSTAKAMSTLEEVPESFIPTLDSIIDLVKKSQLP